MLKRATETIKQHIMANLHKAKVIPISRIKGDDEDGNTSNITNQPRLHVVIIISRFNPAGNSMALQLPGPLPRFSKLPVAKLGVHLLTLVGWASRQGPVRLAGYPLIITAPSGGHAPVLAGYPAN